MTTKWSRLDCEAHCDSCCMPTRCRKAFEHRMLRRSFVQVERLRVEFRGKSLYVVRCDLRFLGRETHSQSKVVKPFDHHGFPPSQCAPRNDSAQAQPLTAVAVILFAHSVESKSSSRAFSIPAKVRKPVSS